MWRKKLFVVYCPEKAVHDVSPDNQAEQNRGLTIWGSGWTEPSSEDEAFTCSETFFFIHLSFYMIIAYLANKGVNRKIKLTSQVQLKKYACTQPQNVIILHFGTEWKSKKYVCMCPPWAREFPSRQANPSQAPLWQAAWQRTDGMCTLCVSCSAACCRFQETFPSIYAAATRICLMWTRGLSKAEKFHKTREIPGWANPTHVSRKATMGATFPRNYAGIDGVEGAGGPPAGGGGALSHRWRC